MKGNHMQAIGLCRFSYPALGGFQVEHATSQERIEYLYQDARIDERFRLFEAVALPCLRAQTDPDFSIIVVIGDQFPKDREAQLVELVADVPQILIHKEPPRNQREVMKEILNDARLNATKPCLQFRFDDDDAVAVDFIAKLRKAAQDCAPLLAQHKTVAFDWSKGFIAEFSATGINAAEVFRPFNVAALGMYVKGNCPLTIMNFSHVKLPQFMPAVSFNDKAMFVRSHNAFNDARQKPVKAEHVAPLSKDQIKVFRGSFGIDIDTVRRVFSAE